VHLLPCGDKKTGFAIAGKARFQDQVESGWFRVATAP
jgi:hypothetical protein